MNKKILISLSVIAAVAAIAIGGTIAFFSDTETSTGNTFSTGVIDININGENPWTGKWNIVDMKPSETGYITFNIQNPGNNPVNVWKTVTVTGTSDEPINEPECVYGGGVWDSTNQACDIDNTNPNWHYTPQSNLHDVMNYDLSVKVHITDNLDGWYQTIYKDSDGKTVGQINNQPIFLGMIPAGGSMKVTQSYHMKGEETGNWAQADTMKFDITIYAEQLKGVLVLENKSGAPDWQILGTDNMKGKLTYNLTSPKFNYTFEATGLPGTQYSLIYYADPWPGDGVTHDTGVLIATFAASGGTISLTTGSVELNRDLPQWPSDQNHPEGAKIWLVPSTDYDAGTHKMTAWNPANYLFETALITYDDTDI